MKHRHSSATEPVHIDGIAHDGRGVGRRNGKAVFVAKALPGEDVLVRLIRSGKRHDDAVMVSVVTPSPDRVEPPCPHAGSCGGCTLQHMRPEAQLASQQARLADALARIGKVAPRTWMEPVPSNPWGYRSRARLAVTRDPHDGEIRVGFHREESSQVEDLDACPVLAPQLAPLPAHLKEALDSLAGPVIPAEIWLAAGEDAIGIGFCSPGALSSRDRATLHAFGESIGAKTGFGCLESPHHRRWESPAPHLTCSPEPGLRLAFAPWDFTQSNPAINQLLVSRVIELLAPGPEDGVLDLFCGIGNFSLPLARRAARVLGVDASTAQVATAALNARDNGLANCTFRTADLFTAEGLRELPGKGFSLAVIDPPRAGAALLCAGLRNLGVRRLAYVSCDAATLARDARTLCASGFRLETAGTLHMFPHTAHAESLALFLR